MSTGTGSTKNDGDADWAPTLAEFGYGSLLQQGKPAIGPRRLAVVLVEYDNDADGSCPPFSAVHPVEYYEKLAFGSPDPPFSTSDPVNPASLAGYLRECSANRFWLTPTALVGPIGDMGPLTDGAHPEARARRIIQRASQLRPDMFLDSDLNGDGVVASSEMLLLIIENIAGDQPANRDNTPLPVAWGGVTKYVTLHVAFDGPFTPFFQIAHEVTHSLGTKDMYGSGSANYLLTVMGGYSFTSNDQRTVHLDAWHKLALGWCEPRRRRLTQPGEDVIVEITSDHPTGPLILWHPDRGASEYFLVERRSSSGVNRAYDSGFPGDGALVWRATSSGAAPTHLGSPDLTVGGNGVWTGGQETPPLPWSDGTSSGVQLTFHTSPVFRVSWK
jgi:M6 family metalloprotease-like protein